MTTPRLNNPFGIVLIAILCLLAQDARAVNALSEFEYRDVTVRVTQADGKPVVGALVYGFCPKLNLIFPRPGKNKHDVLWDNSFPGKTGPDGTLKAKVPSGNWSFFAAGTSASGGIVLVQSKLAMVQPAATIDLSPTVTKQWSLASVDRRSLAPQQLFVRATSFPAFLPVNVKGATQLLRAEISNDTFDLWATGDSQKDHPAFVLSWGRVNSHTPDGILSLPKTPTIVESSAGSAVLSWFHFGSHGLEGTISFTNQQTSWFSSESFIFSWTRPMAAHKASFAGQLYRLDATNRLPFSFDGPLSHGIDQHASRPGKDGKIRLSARLYLVDTNGHVLSSLLTAAGKPVKFDATVRLDGQRLPAAQYTSGDAGQTSFYIDIATNQSIPGTEWRLAALPSLLPELAFTDTPDQRATVSSATFRVDAPKVLHRAAKSLLTQMEGLAHVMSSASGRTRDVQPTLIRIEAGNGDASAAHSGRYIRIGSFLWYQDRPILRHTISHELGHNFDFNHGGLHETMAEIARAGKGPQIGQQDVKWLFFDRMNGTRQKERVGYEKSYANIGLYLYCYAEKGATFARYLSANEERIRRKLKAAGYTEAEITTALCGIAMNRDMRPISQAYGLEIDTTKVADAPRVLRTP